MGGDGESPDAEEWFFDRPFHPGEENRLADEVSGWLYSEHLRWLLGDLTGPGEGLTVASGRDRLASAVAALGEICEWALPGTVWDFRVDGGERLAGGELPAQPYLPAAAIAERAAALGLRAPGRLRAAPRTLVVLGGRRLAPLNRARAAARVIREESLTGVRVVLLCAPRVLDRHERCCPEVHRYAPGAGDEVDLMNAASLAFVDAPVEDVRLVEASAPHGDGRASTYDTLRVLTESLSAEDGPLALFTSPTCRPFQYLDAVRALGLRDDFSFELVAHPPAWAAAPSEPFAPPHVYLQEIRSTIQAAGRLATALTDLPDGRAVALA